MKTFKFNKAVCGVEIKLMVGYGCQHQDIYFNDGFFTTDTFEILFFRKGKGILTLNQQDIAITDNKIIFISPHQTRKWELDRTNLNFTFLVFQEDFLNDFFADKLFTYKLQYFYQLAYPLYSDAKEADIENAFRVLEEIRTELADAKTDSYHLIRSLLYYILMKLNRLYANEYNLQIEKDENHYAFQFKKLMEENIYEKQRISDYTSMMGISRITLNKAVKEQFHVTANHMLKQRLLFEITNYLLHSGLTVSEIAYKLHFSEPNHLMRFFKKQTGLTTSEFIGSYQNGSS